MYAWIDAEAWAAAGQPSLTEDCGFLADLDAPRGGRALPPIYGRLLSEEESLVCARALLQRRVQDPLPLTEDLV